MRRGLSVALFAGLTCLLFLFFADARFETGIRHAEASPGPMAAPNAINSYYFPAIIDPVIDKDPAAAKPFAVGNVDGGILDLHVALQFASPVDLYLALFFPAIYPEVLLIGPDQQILPLSAGFTKWRENIMGPVDQSLFGPLPISGAPAGTYSLGVLATPAGGNFSTYYLWVTSFEISPPVMGHSISGRVVLNGSGLSGVTVTLTGSGSTSTVTDANGYYMFTEAQNGSYTITPSKSGYSFTPASKSVSVNNADLADQDFTATATAPGY